MVTGVNQPATDPTRTLTSSRHLILAVSTFGGFLVTFMASAVNIALPLIEEEFHVSAVTLSWISLAYTLMAGATLLPAGRASDMLGRIRFYAFGMALFTVISFASAFAPSAGALLALRAIHGVALAISWSTAAALVVEAFPARSRGRALGLNIAGIYLGLTLGPVLGGLIIHNLGWRSLFLVLGGLGLVNLGVQLWKLSGIRTSRPQPGRFDVVGSLAYAGGLVAILLGFSLLPGVTGVVLVVVGVAGLAGFVWWEDRVSDPLLEIDLFRRNRVFAYSNAAAFINYAATFAMIFLLSLYLQYNRGLNAQTAGYTLVAGTFVQSVMSPVAGRLADRVQARYLASVGMAICTLGLFALSFVSTTTPYWYIIAMTCVLGLGFALFASPNNYIVMASLEPRLLTMGSATLAAMRLAGQSMSMGLATLVLAIQVGGRGIEPADYPQVLTGVRTSFLIFTCLCALGVGASLVGPKRREQPGS